MLGAITAGLKALGSALGIIEKEQEAVADEKLRQAGRDSQNAANAKESLTIAKDQNAREESLARSSGDALDERLRKSIDC